jgi:hypothetical protein
MHLLVFHKDFNSHPISKNLSSFLEKEAARNCSATWTAGMQEITGVRQETTLIWAAT